MKQFSNQTIGLKSTAIIIGLFLFLPNSVLAIKNLPVPFTSQAPYGNWNQPWQDTCEETAILMVDNFYNNKKLSDKSVAKQEILRILNIKNNGYGKSLDENAEQMATLINDFLNWEATIIENPTIEQIKTQIDVGQPVIIPAYGKALKNSRFRNGGPEFHTVVISGYDDDKKQFITQEPGTRYGLDFRYNYDTLMKWLFPDKKIYKIIARSSNGPPATLRKRACSRSVAGG
ncbi:MAG: C39 family peptidase [Candidatus Magasanikbacteria bacterium]|nr:C39 family peptidase [Candidatus Magasanikbacteria bacterium]